MRTRPLIALLALLLPAGLSAQRIPSPRARRPGPARPAPLPPQPDPIARGLGYRRLRISVEGYPMVSYVHSPGFTGDGVVSAWTTFGTGTRADYRLSPHTSATLDLTSSFAGGPAIMETVELGTRLRPESREHRAYPFVDVRVGYTYAYNRYLGGLGDAYVYPTGEPVDYSRYSSGFGGVAGVGMEYALTRKLSLTTAGSVMRSRLTTRSLFDPTPDRSFAMTSYRYTLGISYNPVRVVRPPGTDPR